jgi:hypothetical protein
VGRSVGLAHSRLHAAVAVEVPDAGGAVPVVHVCGRVEGGQRARAKGRGRVSDGQERCNKRETYARRRGCTQAGRAAASRTAHGDHASGRDNRLRNSVCVGVVCSRWTSDQSIGQSMVSRLRRPQRRRASSGLPHPAGEPRRRGQAGSRPRACQTAPTTRMSRAGLTRRAWFRKVVPLTVHGDAAAVLGACKGRGRVSGERSRCRHAKRSYAPEEPAAAHRHTPPLRQDWDISLAALEFQHHLPAKT